MTIHQKWTGDPSQLLKSYQELSAANTRLEQQVGKLANTMGDGGRKAIQNQTALSSALRTSASEVQSLTQQWAGMAVVLGAVKSGLDQVNQRQIRAAETNIKVGGSEADIVRNMPSRSIEEQRQYLGQVRRSFAQSGFPSIEEYNRSVASGLSASSENTEATLNATAAAAKIVRDRPEDLSLMTGAALDIQKASGVKDARRNLSFMMQVGAESRMVDTRQNAINVPAAVIAGANTAKGDRQQAAIDAGAIFAALSTQTGDVRGESTSTNTISLETQMRDYFEKGIEVSVHGHKIRHKPKLDPGTHEGRISYLQKNEKERKRFLENSSFERKYQVPVEQLLTAGSETDQQFRASRGKIGFGVEAYDRTEESLRTVSSQIAFATTDAASQGKKQLAEIANIRQGYISKARQYRDEGMWEAADYSPQVAPFKYITDQAENAYDYAKGLEGRDALQDSLNRVERRKRDVLQPGSLLGGRDNLAKARKYEDLNPDERRAYDALEGSAQLIRELIAQDKVAAEEAKKQTELLREMRDAAVGANRNPAAAANAARAERGMGREQ